MSNLIGQFYFKKTSNGNLLGEFSNQFSLIPSTESADIIIKKDEKPSDSFVGKYNSTWQENSKARIAILTIIPKPDAINVFLLVWEMKGVDTFWGEGFLVDDMLIGHYRNFENIN